MKQWPVPTDGTQLKSFFGFASYHRQFIPNFAAIANPLFCMSQKQPIIWTDECSKAFTELKDRLTSPPVLAFPQKDGGKFILDTDASDYSIGAVLSQLQNGEEKVIAYASQSLSKSEKNYSVTRKELLALVYFMQYFCCYLLHTKFIVRTDHAALQWIQGFKNPEGQLARWLKKLQEFNFESMHRKGSEHHNADTISRLPKDSSQSVTAISNSESKVFTIDGEQTSWIPSYTSQLITQWYNRTE